MEWIVITAFAVVGATFMYVVLEANIHNHKHKANR